MARRKRQPSLDREAPDCDDWSFDREAWDAPDTADDEALAVVRCDALTGMTRAQVEGLVGGRHGEEDGRWTFSAGAVHDYIGPGDGQALFVHFDRRDRVERAVLRYGGRGGRQERD